MVADDLARVTVVLCRARNPQNIGAVARAMHDLGFSSLRVVNEFAVPFQAAKSAVDASAVLAGAGEFAAVAEAVADCTLVLGTTAVGARALVHEVLALNAAAGLVRGHLAGAGARVALLFGSEKTGLTNDELSHCHRLLTIPMQAAEGKHLSMNLGQAAAVCLYQIAQGDVVSAVAGEPAPAAAAGEVERLTGLLAETLEAAGYTRRHPAAAREANVRRLVRHMTLRAEDAPVWTGILRQVLHGLGASKEKQERG